jgi:hypothetical protein
MNKFKQTKRSFYGKWLYKISLDIPGIAIFRERSFDQIVQILLIPDVTRTPTAYVRKARANREAILEFTSTIGKRKKDSYALRIQSDTVDVYTNNKRFFNLLTKKFEQNLKVAYYPTADALTVLSDKKNIIVNKYPHDLYQHKVFLLPHRVKNKDDKTRMVSWLETQGDKITLSPAVKRWFVDTNWNWDRRYIMVDNQSTLLMLNLRLGDAVGQVYDYVIADK